MLLQQASPPKFFRKRCVNAFVAAVARIDPASPRHRIAIVGDTLHTDVLGGRAAGLGTVLTARHGLFAGLDPAPYAARSGILPDWIAETT